MLTNYINNVRVSLGEQATLYCYARYDFRHRSAWKRNGVYLESTGRYNIRSQSKRRRTNMYLEISEVNAQDFGNYTCEVSNRFGKTSGVVQLIRQIDRH